MSTLKVKGFVLGPIHQNQKDDLTGTNLEQIAPTFGSKEDFDSLLQSAKKKSGCPRAREQLGRAWPSGQRRGRIALLSGLLLGGSEFS